MKLNLGCGQEILEGYVNCDLLDLPGVDVAHNLMNFPYPFDNESAEYIKAKDLIEHLASYVPYRPEEVRFMPEENPDLSRVGQPTIIAFIEEAHRILKPGGTLWIQTPRYDAEFLWHDPSHVRGFTERSMDFFDKTTDFGKSTGFYSNVDFGVSVKTMENLNLQFTMVKR